MSGANSNQLVQKLLNFRNILRDDGVSTIAYVEQLTCLLFLKMADERKKAGLGEVVLVCAGSSARQTQMTQNRPVDATIMAIVDEVAEGGELRYRKDG